MFLTRRLPIFIIQPIISILYHMLFNSCYFIVPVKHLICVTESNNSRYNQSVIASNVGCYANNKFNIIKEDGVARGV